MTKDKLLEVEVWIGDTLGEDGPEVPRGYRWDAESVARTVRELVAEHKASHAED